MCLTSELNFAERFHIDKWSGMKIFREIVSKEDPQSDMSSAGYL
jgi:hypothetical protein